MGLGPRRRERHAIGDRAERTDSAPEMQVSPSAAAEPQRQPCGACLWELLSAQASPSRAM